MLSLESKLCTEDAWKVLQEMERIHFKNSKIAFYFFFVIFYKALDETLKEKFFLKFIFEATN